MSNPNIFTTIFVFPILNVLILFYKALEIIKIPGALGFSILLLTVLVRVILHPFFKSQIETAKKMQDIKPHLDKLSKKHKKNPKKLQEEQMKLYKEMGINPASGCLLMIIQVPIFIGLYQTLSMLLVNTDLTKIVTDINNALYFSFLRINSINPWFFGINLAISPSKANNVFYLLIPLVIGVLQYYQSIVTLPSNKNEKKDDKVNKDKKKSEPDFQKAMGTQFKIIFPLMIGWFAYTLPVGLSVYWGIFSVFTIMQYRSMQKKSPEVVTSGKN